MELAQLIERLENLAGPDRELDGAIYRSTHVAIEDAWKHWTSVQREELTPRYTASIDAALALVPEGFAIERWMIWPGHPSSIEIVGTHQESGDDTYWHARGDGRWDAQHPVPAIVLCIAALKARAHAAAGTEKE